MDEDDMYLPKLDDLKSCDQLFEGTHDIELERLDLEGDFESANSDSELDWDDTEFMASIWEDISYESDLPSHWIQTANLDQCQDKGKETESESDGPFAAKMEFAHRKMLGNNNGDESPGQKDI